MSFFPPIRLAAFFFSALHLLAGLGFLVLTCILGARLFCARHFEGGNGLEGGSD